jgi:hypothetical protein
MPIIAIVGIIIVALAGTYVFLKPSTLPNTETTPVTEEMRIDDVIETEEVGVTDETNPSADTTTTDSLSTAGLSGTYTANASYLTPARTEHVVAITITMENGLVTDSVVEFDGKTAGSYSNDNQNRFDQAYKSQVVGKRLEDINLARVGGASLTSNAYNEAVAKISTQNS